MASVEFKQGDIFSSDAEALVNAVNCVGVMGRGVALQFKSAYPANFKAYATACARKEMQLGHMFVFETGLFGNPKFIINFPTKRHWRDASRLEDIESGLKALKEIVQERGIRSLAVPALGCGLGGLEWNDVRSRIQGVLGTLNAVHVIAFEPRDVQVS